MCSFLEHRLMDVKHILKGDVMLYKLTTLDRIMKEGLYQLRTLEAMNTRIDVRALPTHYDFHALGEAKRDGLWGYVLEMRTITRRLIIVRR